MVVDGCGWLWMVVDGCGWFKTLRVLNHPQPKMEYTTTSF